MSNRLNAWLLFLGSDDPEDIIGLIEQYPDFKAMYQQIYEMCADMEDMMGLFSKELAIMDNNTVTYMIDEMQVEIDRQKAELARKDSELEQNRSELKQKDDELKEKDRELENLKQLVAQLTAKTSDSDK